MIIRQLQCCVRVVTIITFFCYFIFHYKSVDHSKKQNLYIASAYLVKDLDRQDKVIRILSAAEGPKIKSKLYCQMNKTNIKAKIIRLNNGNGCKWRYFFIECPIRSSLKLLEFNLTTNFSTKQRHLVKIKQPSQQKRNFVICFSRAFNYERWQNLISALHFYKFYGVDLMVIPIVSVIADIYTLLNAYEQEGYVRLKSALFIPKITGLSYNPNEEIDVFNQVLNFDDCLYQYREKTEFMAFIDFDDLIQPIHYSLYEEFQQYSLNYPNLASFEFQWPPTGAITTSNPLTFKMDKLIKSLAWVNLPKYGKSIVRPMRIRHSFVHRPLSPKIELIGDYKHKFFKNKNSTLILHVRHLVEPENAYKYFPNNTCLQSDNNCLHKNASKLVNQQFRAFLKKYKHAKQAFINLPSTFPYYEATLNCPQLSNTRTCYSPLVCNSNVNITKLSPCVLIDEWAEQITTYFDHLKIYSVGRRRFVTRENCLKI